MSKAPIKIAIAQLNFIVGDIEGNCKKICTAIHSAKQQFDADCIVFTELAITGYPPEDLLFRSKILSRIETALKKVTDEARGITVIIGSPWAEEERLYNAALVLQDQLVIARYYKQTLPNYNEFDEKRYFTAGHNASVFELCGVRIGITICEDIWQKGPASAVKQLGADLIININASPYYAAKQDEREKEVRKRVAENELPVIYANQLGGQDELVFDGCSFAMNRNQEIICRAPECEESIFLLEFNNSSQDLLGEPLATLNTDINRSIYNILTFGLQEYVRKNGFGGTVIGLSGGIDSALVLTLAVDAIGPDKVHAVMMPSQYTSQMSLEDAQALADNLNVKYSVISIESIYESTLQSLDELFANTQVDSTEENIQARIRGVLLMAISNKFNHMVISTGNKSEMAVGYATLYGDMAGGFAPLKDVPKMRVFELARYRNRISPVIPQRIIDRPPSAELAPDQKDEDSLPPYQILDEILELFVEQDIAREQIIARGFDADIVAQVIRMVFRNEYKRRQAPPGVKISKRAFGKDRRYPITSGVLNYLNDT